MGFGSAAGGYLAALSPVYDELALLAEGDYEVWAIMHGPVAQVRRTYGTLAASVRVFAVDGDWDGWERLEILRLPALYAAGQDNVIAIAIEGWDRERWQQAIRDLRAFLAWRPCALSRDLPPSGSVVIGSPDD